MVSDQTIQMCVGILAGMGVTGAELAEVRKRLGGGGRDRLVSLPEILEATGIGKSTLWRRIAECEVPLETLPGYSQRRGVRLSVARKVFGDVFGE